MTKTSDIRVFYADYLNGSLSTSDLAAVKTFSELSNLLSLDQIDDMYPVSLSGYTNPDYVPSRIGENTDDYELPF